MKPTFKKGDVVNYHARIGGPITSTGHVLKDDPFQVNGQQHWLAFITGKSGYVAVEALSMTPIICKQCGVREVEESRRCYATPVCHACLPPPKPLPIAPMKP